MGAKVSKLTSTKVAWQCYHAFSKVLKNVRKLHKEVCVHANSDAFMNYAYRMFKKVVCLYNLQRCFYPLDAFDYLDDESYYYGFDWCKNYVNLCIACIHPLMLNYGKLNNDSCVKLIRFMTNNLSAVIYEDLKVVKFL